MKKHVLHAIAAILLCMALASCATVERPLTVAELLDLGEKYLLELNYEQALVQFLKVIEVEPMNPRGYTGAAEAYVGLEQHNDARAVLERGLALLPNSDAIAEILQKLVSDYALDVVPNDENETATASAIAQPWDSFTEMQKRMLEDLELATEALDYETAHEIMTSTAFVDFRFQLTRSYGNRRTLIYKRDESSRWGIDVIDDFGGTYKWSRTNHDLQISAIFSGSPLADRYHSSLRLRHDNVVDGVANGEYTEVALFFSRHNDYNSLDLDSVRRIEGTALDGLRHGVEVDNTYIMYAGGGQRSYQYIIHYDHGLITNYLIDDDNPDSPYYILSESGEERRSAQPTQIYRRNIIHRVAK